MKKSVCLLLLVGVLLMGTVSQVLAEDKKAEGIISEISKSDQSEKPFFSKENPILLAQYVYCLGYTNEIDCNKQFPICVWFSSNSSAGVCYWVH